MNVKLLVCGVLPLLASGCASHPVPEHFRPVTDIAQRPIEIGDSITMLNTTVWVNNLDEYLKRKPEGSPLYNGDMIHERIHSIRMDGLLGTIAFVTEYLFSTDFMWEEESIGWYYELMYLRTKGIVKPFAYTASFLSKGYSNLFGSEMISYEDALQWVKDVYAGRWKPPISKEEEDLYYNDVLKKLNGR